MTDLKPGSHLCCFYETEAEHRAILTPYLQYGLARGEKVIYIVDERTADVVQRYLHDAGLAVEDYIDRGQLVLLTSEETYVKHGVFDPEAMIALIQAEVDKALDEGYPLLRLTGEMTWVLRGLPGSQRLIEYEARLNEFLPYVQCIALCQYDQRRFQPDLLLNILYTHPIVAVGALVLDNVYYTPPAVFLHSDPTSTKWRYLIESLAQRHQAEEAYRTLVEHSLQGLAIFQGERIVFANEALARMVGYSRDELLAFSAGDVRSILHPDDRDQVWRWMQDHLREQSIPPRWQFRFIHRDRSICWVEALVSHIEYRDEPAIQIAYLDVSERKRAERALRESEARLRTLIESTEDIVCLHDFDGRYLYYHGPSRYGIYAADVLGQTPVDLFGEEDARPIIEQIQEVVRRGESKTVENYVTWQGETLCFSDQIIPVRDEQGHITAVAKYCRNVTERKKTDEILRRRNREMALLNRAGHAISSSLNLDQILNTLLEEIRHLLDVVACSVWLLDPATDELVCQQATGPQKEHVRGWRLSLEQGLAGWSARHGESLLVDDVRVDERYYAEIARQIGLDIRSILTVPLKAKETSIGVIQVIDIQVGRFQKMDLHLLEPLASSAAIAIENARLYDAELLARQQLRDLASYLQTAREEERAYVAREIHDELGQMLTALKIDLSSLDQYLPEADPEVRERLLAMSDLVNETIRTVRRVATELRPGLLDDLGLVAALEWQAQDFEDRTGMTCEIQLPYEDMSLNQDLATTFFRIFQEALTNVARHARATRVQVSFERTPHNLTLTVQDDGVGITPAQIADPKSLGLIGIRERVRAWHGEASFHGIPDQGTSVVVRIPLNDAVWREESLHI